MATRDLELLAHTAARRVIRTGSGVFGILGEELDWVEERILGQPDIHQVALFDDMTRAVRQ
jgi:hypothetical protein